MELQVDYIMEQKNPTKIWKLLLYENYGVKQGLWVEFTKNFCMNQASVVEIGEYKNYCKIGNWSYEFENQKIQGGSYNVNSEKQRKWVELSKEFYLYSQVIYVGEHKNNQKVGIWEILYKNHVKEQKNQQMQNIQEQCAYLFVEVDYIAITLKLENGLS